MGACVRGLREKKRNCSRSGLPKTRKPINFISRVSFIGISGRRRISRKRRTTSVKLFRRILGMLSYAGLADSYSLLGDALPSTVRSLAESQNRGDAGWTLTIVLRSAYVSGPCQEHLNGIGREPKGIQACHRAESEPGHGAPLVRRLSDDMVASTRVLPKRRKPRIGSSLSHHQYTMGWQFYVAGGMRMRSNNYGKF